MGDYNSASRVTLTNCTLENNTATFAGGAVYNSSGTTSLSGCTVSGNHADERGGGIYVVCDTINISSCTIKNNTSDIYGGGIGMSGVNNYINFTNSTVSGNSAPNGGGVWLLGYNSSFTMTSGTITGNTATSNGGGVNLYAEVTKLDMRGGKIYGNTAGGYGSDIYSNGGDIEIASTDAIWYFDGFKDGETIERYDPKTGETLKTISLTRVYAALNSMFINKYTVSFDPGFAGAARIASQTVEEDELASAPAEPVREDFDFLGWYNGDERFDFSTPITENITLKAMWKDLSAEDDSPAPQDDSIPVAKEDDDDDHGIGGDRAPRTGEGDDVAPPKTGDDSHTELMAALMALSGLTLAGMAVTSVVKKRKHSAE